MNETDGNHFEQLLKQALPALQSKKEELIVLGYDDVTVQAIVDCLHYHIWKKKRPNKLYKIVQDILNLKPSVYMNFITTTAISLDDDLLKSISAVTGTSENEA